MKLTSKTITHQLVFIAIMSAITIVLSILTDIIPFMSIFLIIFLPFVAGLVAITTDLKYYPIYVVTSILLSIVIDASNFFSIIFYLLPSLLSGLVIGLTYRIKINGLYILLGITLVNLLANYAIVPVLDNLYQIDFMSYTLGFVGLANHPYSNALFLLVLFIIGLVQASFTYMIVNEEIHIIKGAIAEKYDRSSLIVLAATGGLSTMFHFFHLGLALIFLGLSFALVIYQLVHLIKTNINRFYVTVGLIVFSLPFSFVLSELSHFNVVSFYLILQVLIVVILMFLWEYILSNKEKING